MSRIVAGRPCVDPEGTTVETFPAKGRLAGARALAAKRSDLPIASQSPGKAQRELERNKGASHPSYILECR